MDSELEDDSEKLGKAIPVLSDYVKGLGTRVKERYLAKMSVIEVDLAGIPKEQFNGECLPPIKVRIFLDIWFWKRAEPLYEKRIQSLLKFERL